MKVKTHWMIAMVLGGMLTLPAWGADLAAMQKALSLTANKPMPLAAFQKLMGPPDKLETSPRDPGAKQRYSYTSGDCNLNFEVDPKSKSAKYAGYVDFSGKDSCRFKAIISEAEYKENVAKYGEPIALFMKKRDNLPSSAPEAMVLKQFGKPSASKPNQQGGKDLQYTLGGCQFTFSLTANKTVGGSGYFCTR